jgi:hypothetical protein
MEWSVGGLGQGGSKFLNFYQTRKIGLILPSLVDFDRVWLILTEFEFLTRFYMLYTCWLVKSYDFTSQFVILTTMMVTIGYQLNLFLLLTQASWLSPLNSS